MEGLSKKDLEKQRAELISEIALLEEDEKEQSSMIHVAHAKKDNCKIALINAKNRISMLDLLIASCKELNMGPGALTRID